MPCPSFFHFRGEACLSRMLPVQKHCKQGHHMISRHRGRRAASNQCKATQCWAIVVTINIAAIIVVTTIVSSRINLVIAASCSSSASLFHQCNQPEALTCFVAEGGLGCYHRSCSGESCPSISSPNASL